jgi:hypothetical protein
MNICKQSEENIWKETKYCKRRENSENPWNEDHAVDDLASAVAAVSAISGVPVVACTLYVASTPPLLPVSMLLLASLSLMLHILGVAGVVVFLAFS